MACQKTIQAIIDGALGAGVGRLPPPPIFPRQERRRVLEPGQAQGHGQHCELRGHVRQDAHGGTDQLRPALQRDHLQQGRRGPVQLYLCQAPDRIVLVLLQHYV